MVRCFFFSGDSGAIVFFTTPSLSQKTEVFPSNGIPIIQSLYRRPPIISTAVHSATKSEPNVKDSMKKQSEAGDRQKKLLRTLPLIPDKIVTDRVAKESGSEWKSDS
jgi:hypothetical protein